jgi:hypothetical protein
VPVPVELQQELYTAMRRPLANVSEAPSCFCIKNELCQQHTTYEPTIDEMIVLVEDQISEINKDESSVETNLEFIYSTLESILLTRRDTFKEQLTRYYKQKDTEVMHLRERLQSMESSKSRARETGGSDRQSILKQSRFGASRQTTKSVAQEPMQQVLKDRDEARSKLVEMQAELDSARSEWERMSKQVQAQ